MRPLHDTFHHFSLNEQFVNILNVLRIQCRSGRTPPRMHMGGDRTTIRYQPNSKNEENQSEPGHCTNRFSSQNGELYMRHSSALAHVSGWKQKHG